MRTDTQEAVLSAYIAATGKRAPREAAQDAAELCRLVNSRSRLASLAGKNPAPSVNNYARENAAKKIHNG
jgi:hypothetical protein